MQVQHVPNKCEALSTNPSTVKRTKKKKNNQCKKGKGVASMVKLLQALGSEFNFQDC
jgi:hypothetical protein